MIGRRDYFGHIETVCGEYRFLLFFFSLLFLFCRICLVLNRDVVVIARNHTLYVYMLNITWLLIWLKCCLPDLLRLVLYFFDACIFRTIFLCVFLCFFFSILFSLQRGIIQSTDCKLKAQGWIAVLIFNHLISAGRMFYYYLY